MQYSFLLTTGLLVQSTCATWLLPTARNFIYIVPDGEFHHQDHLIDKDEMPLSTAAKI